MLLLILATLPNKPNTNRSRSIGSPQEREAGSGCRRQPFSKALSLYQEAPSGCLAVQGRKRGRGKQPGLACQGHCNPASSLKASRSQGQKEGKVMVCVRMDRWAEECNTARARLGGESCSPGGGSEILLAAAASLTCSHNGLIFGRKPVRGPPPHVESAGRAVPTICHCPGTFSPPPKRGGQSFIASSGFGGHSSP